MFVRKAGLPNLYCYQLQYLTTAFGVVITAGISA